MDLPKRLILTGGTIDLRRRKFLTPEGDLRLTAREIQVVERLLMAEGKPVSRDDLAEEIWGHRPGVQSRAIDQAFKRLRAKVEVDPKDPEHIITVHGVGYQLVLEPELPTVDEPPTQFIGRERDLAQIKSWWTDGGRLLTIAGVGGAGKTRLVRQALRDITGGGSVCVVSDCTNTSDAILAIRDTLELPESGNTAEAAGLRDFAIQLSFRDPTLLVIDNAETVIEPVADVVATCIRHAPNLRFMVTSREPLAIRGERVLRLAPLCADDAIALLHTRLSECGGSVESVPHHIATNAVEIVDRLPLGIELLVFTATIRGENINENWTPDLALRDQGPRDLPERQHSLWNVVAWSWRGLSADHQRALMRLSILPSAHSARELEIYSLQCSQNARRVLAELHRRSLLELAHDTRLGTRYRLLHPIREFARKQLEEAGLLEEAEKDFVQAVLQMARNKIGRPGMSPNPDSSAWARKLRGSLDLAATLSAPQSPNSSAEITLLTEEALRSWRSPSRRNRRLDRALSFPGLDPLLRMGLLLRRAIGGFYANDFELAESLSRAVANLGETTEQTFIYVRARCLLAQTLYSAQRHSEAIQVARDLVDEHGATIPDPLYTVAAGVLLWTAYNYGDFDACESTLESARERFGANLPVSILAFSLGIRRDQGDPHLSLDDWEECLNRVRDAGSEGDGQVLEKTRYLIDSGHLDAAEKELDQLFDRNEERPSMEQGFYRSFVNDAHYLRALVLALQGSINSAAQVLDARLAVNAAHASDTHTAEVRNFYLLSLRIALGRLFDTVSDAEHLLEPLRELAGTPASPRALPIVRILTSLSPPTSPERSGHHRFSLSALTLKEGESPSADLRCLWAITQKASQSRTINTQAHKRPG